MRYRVVPKAVLLLVFLCQPVAGQPPDGDDALQQLQLHRSRVETLEADLGRYHQQLLEPLVSLAGVYANLHQYDETHALLDRALQITRVNLGLYSEAQFPVLQMMARNSVSRGDWETANQALEHVFWLYTNKHRGFDAALVDELLQLADLHMEGVVADVIEMRAAHFRSAARITGTAIRVGEQIWPPHEPRLAELYYRLARNYFLQKVAMEQGGAAAYEIREIIPGSRWVRPRKTALGLFHRAGEALLERMAETFQQAEPPDLEALAMVQLYLADWQVMFSRPSAGREYEKAFSQLLAANVPAHVLEALFARPVALPVQDFHYRAAAALERIPTELRLEGQQVLRYVEWSPAFPNVQEPADERTGSGAAPSEHESALLAVTLPGVDRISRWVGGRYVTQVGVASEFELAGGTTNAALTEIAERVHYLNFRPAMEEGEVRAFEGMLDFRFFPRPAQ